MHDKSLFGPTRVATIPTPYLQRQLNLQLAPHTENPTAYPEAYASFTIKPKLPL